MSTVGDIMSTGLFSIEPTTTVAEAATVMGERRIGSALVMEDEMLLGIFTERDIVRALGEHFDAAGHPVADWMTPNPVTVEASTPVEEALRMMLDRNFRHLPVAEGGRVSGIVSMRDLTAAGVAAPSEG